MTCTQCGLGLQPAVSAYSSNEFGYELCLEHQHWFRNLATSTKLSKEAADLYFALKERGQEVSLQKCDDSKSVDIRLHDARINIQVDGAHHHNDYYQTLDNLRTSHEAFLKGYMTFRLPANLIRNNIDEATDYIADLLQQHSSAWHSDSYMAQTI